MPSAMSSRNWAEVPSEAVAAGVERKYITAERVTVARFELARGAVVPRHAHDNEQVTQVLHGALRVLTDAGEIVLRDGDLLQIPGGMPHEVQVLEDTSVIDVFSPVRQDWIDGKDDYFRRRASSVDSRLSTS